MGGAEGGRVDEAEFRSGERTYLAPVRDGVVDLTTSVRIVHGQGTAAVPPEGLPSILELVRGFLAAGRSVLFRAYGRSMRPSIPHGSMLLIEPRTADALRIGQIVAYAGRPTEEESGAQAAPSILVAHRVVGRKEGGLVARGDSAGRTDRVANDDVLGLVREVRSIDRFGRLRRKPVDGLLDRGGGLLCGMLYRGATAIVRPLVIRPLRRSFAGGSFIRKMLVFVLRVLCRILRIAEVGAFRARYRLEVLWSALLSTREKDEGRRRLYEKKAVRDFTALDENIEAGLTLLEEVIFWRHPIEPGRALVVGCGPGRECIALAERGFEVTGIDRDPAMLEHGRRLAEKHSRSVRFLAGEATTFRIDGETFALVVVFSGLYNMILPAAERVRMLATCREYLAPNGRILITFLSHYLRPGTPPPSRSKTFLEAVNPEHEDGDHFLLNEAVHIFPHPSRIGEEAERAGLRVTTLWRDQRSYDRSLNQVRGYAVLERP